MGVGVGAGCRMHMQSPKGAIPYKQCGGGAVAVTAKIKHTENMNTPHGSMCEFFFYLSRVETKVQAVTTAPSKRHLYFLCLHNFMVTLPLQHQNMESYAALPHYHPHNTKC